MVHRLMSWLYRRRSGMQHRLLHWPVALAIIIAIHLVSGHFVLGLYVNNAPEVYYPSDSPAVLLRNELRRDFPGDEVLTVVFQGPDLYKPEFLTRLDRLVADVERHPLVDRVTSITSLERISGTGDGFAVERLVDPTRLKNTTPDALRQRVMEDRFAPGLLASRDGSTLALVVRPKALAESADRLELKIAVAKAINGAELRSYYAGDAGPVTMDVAQLASALGDTNLLVPLTVAIGLLLLAWVVGRLRPVIIGAMAMSTAVLPTIAAISVTGQPYTLVSAILPTLVAAYTLATLLHLYAGVQRARAAGMSRAMGVDQALAETRKPGAFNVLTTGAGLLSLVLVPIPPVQVFGMAGAWGTLLVFVTVFFLVPPFLLHWDRKPWPRRGSGMSRLGRIASRVALMSMRHPKAILVGAALVLVATLPFALQVKVETDLLAYFGTDHPVNRSTRLIESKLSGVTSLEISLKGDARDSLKNVATLATVRDFQQWLEALPEVDRSVSLVDLVEQMHWAMNGEKPAFKTLPATDRLLHQYLLVYDGKDLYELVNRDFQHARIVLNVNVHGAKAIGTVIETIRQRLVSHPLPGLQVDIGGYGRLFADQVELLVTGQVNSFSGAFLQIVLLMTLLWRSLLAAILCMLPNLAPLYFIFVLMGAAGINLDMATVMIAGVVLGITVDDTIHLYHGYQRRRQAGISAVLAIARAFESSGRAVLAISVLLVAQFMLLTTSDFIPTANFGLMTAVGLLAGQAAELLLLPALLVLKDVRRRPKGPAVTEYPSQATDTAWAPTMLVAHGSDVLAPQSRPRAAQGPDESAHEASGTAPLTRILVCMGAECQACGSATVWQRLVMMRDQLRGQGRGNTTRLVQTSCLGQCQSAPCVQVVAARGLDQGRDQDQLVMAVRAHMMDDDQSRGVNHASPVRPR